MSASTYKIIAALTGAGVLIAAFRGGGAAAAGFLIGAGYSVLSVRFLHRVVESLGTDRPRRASATFLAMRFLLLGLLLYVILRFLQTGMIAALCGLFVGIAAVILDSVYQLYARTP